MVDTHQLRAGLYVGRTLLPNRKRDLTVPVDNTTAEPYRLEAGTCFGEVHVVDIVDEGKSNTAARAATVTAATQSNTVGSGAYDATRTATTKSARTRSSHYGISCRMLCLLNREGRLNSCCIVIRTFSPLDHTIWVERISWNTRLTLETTGP